MSADCACWECRELVGNMVVTETDYMGSFELLVRHECPCEGCYRSDRVDLDLAPESALLALRPADWAALLADLLTDGDLTTYGRLARLYGEDAAIDDAACAVAEERDAMMDRRAA